MKVSIDSDGQRAVKLSKPELRALQSAFPILEQLAYHLRGQSGEDEAQDAADAVASFIAPKVPTEQEVAGE